MSDQTTYAELLQEVQGLRIWVHDLLAAQRRSREEQARYRLLTEKVRDVIWTMDMEARPTFFSQSIEDLTGYSPAEALLLGAERLITRESFERAQAVLWERVAKQGSPEYERLRSQPVEIEYLCRDGSTRPTEACTSFIRDEQGQPVGVIGISRDISARRKAEYLLRRYQEELETRVRERTCELEQANRRLQSEIIERRLAEEQRAQMESRLRQAQKMEAIGTLAGGIAHDFNNVLAAIIGYSELVREDIDPGSLARANMDEVMQAAYRARGLVQQILAFSRPVKAGGEVVPLGAILAESLQMLSATLPPAITLEQYLTDADDRVCGDPVQMHQIAMNLCTNAIQAMGRGPGRLKVTCVAVELQEAFVKCRPGVEPGPYVRLTVSDTGAGMEPLVLERIFEPFFTTKAVGQGTGLGLAMVHGQVTALGGAIFVESSPGRGSTFSVYLPRVREAPEPAAGRDRPVVLHGGGGEHILLVDDERSIIQMASQMLERQGYRVTAACDGFQALELLREGGERFDLVITDQVMPRLSGVDLARCLKESFSPIPVILCTGCGEQALEAAAFQAGIRVCLTKPVDSGVLAEAIRRVLGGS